METQLATPYGRTQGKVTPKVGRLGFERNYHQAVQGSANLRCILYRLKPHHRLYSLPCYRDFLLGSLTRILS
ncbi:hypothetical protein O6P43_002574 [Quillaja saponaria]|uniref:Uncharacterized protein n=1 Tax=Quillaja saponaria TaxID=32244 RepID=A0AAD7QCT0_QUISA|nr:hypothetical protein O6P43_002574 [Quillaja saponaria]